MSVIDVTSQQSKPAFIQTIRQYWDKGFNRLFWDYIKKGLQLGSVFGTAIVLPLTILHDLKRLKMFSFRRIMNRQAAALTIGVGFSLTWMMIRYMSWTNKDQKIHQQTYYLPGPVQSQLDYITTFWGGAAFVGTFIFTRRILLSYGMMSPVIAVGIAQSQIYRFFGPKQVY